jgi:hypothetical protein
MKIDLVYLKQHYSSLSDEALLAVDSSDLVPAARQVLDAELSTRGLNTAGDFAVLPGDLDDGSENASSLIDSDIAPNWLEDAAEVWSCVVYPGRGPAPEAAEAQAALTEAGIPSHLELQEIAPDQEAARQVKHQWRLLVPGAMNMQAISELDREIFNEDFENEWRAHMEVFTDEELRAMPPKIAFGGLFDRVERVTRAYNEELARRGLK